MNELLGWYGYDKMNTGDTQALNLSLFSASTSFPRKSRNATVTAVSDGSSSSSEDSVGGIHSNSSISPGRRDGSVSPNNAVCVPAGCSSCGWCHKIGPIRCFTFKMANCDKVFCSEVCFTHYRRANFKRNKTCDWCRHVRHTINYVDLQDGDSQYQFCSDKCLNQFKLDIFCQETKEHLEIHPHHQEQLQNLESSSLSSLITPDLWLKNCASPPSSDKSRSSTPVNVSPVSPGTIPVEIKKEFNLSPIEEPCKKKCKKYSDSKKKKIKKPAKSSSITKPDDVAPKSSQTSEITTPRIPFYPNFSSMLPSNVPPDYVRSPYYQPLLQSSFTRPVTPRNSLNTSQIPPLLPITRPPQISNSSAFVPPPSTPAKSLLPPPSVLVPYPILLPLPIPIPIPIPLPLFLNEKKIETKIEEPINDSEDEKSSASSSVAAVSIPEKSTKKRKKIEGEIKHLVENY